MSQLLQRFADVKAGRVSTISQITRWNRRHGHEIRLRAYGYHIGGAAFAIAADGTIRIAYDGDNPITVSRSEAARLVRAIRAQIKLLMRRHEYATIRFDAASAAEASHQRAKCAARVVAAFVRSKTDKIRQWPGMSIRIFGNRSGAEVSTTRGDVWLFSRSQAAEFLRGYRSSARKADAERHAALATYAAESKADENR